MYVAHSILTEFIQAAGFTRLDLKLESDVLQIVLWKGQHAWSLATRFSWEQHELVSLTLIAKAKEALLAKFRTIKTT
jgi:hypothetical protein